MSHEDKARDDLENVERDIVEALYGANWTPQAVRDLTDRLHATISTALRQAADTWYRIDDPEHPAPKDGTAILVFCPDAIEPQIFIAIYVRWDNSATGEAIGEDWIDLGNEQQIDAEITHWRPLPPPPSDKGGA